MGKAYLCTLQDVMVSEGQDITLDNIQYKIRESVVEAYISQDGSASTLLQVIGGFRNVNGGNVEYPLHSPKKKHLARWMQYVPDDIICYTDMKVKEFLKGVAMALPEQDAYKEAVRLCELFEIELGEELLNLTFQQNRLVAMIQAMIAKPALLLLDHPADMLDRRHYNRLLKELMRLRDNGTSILIAAGSYEDVVISCDRYLFLKEGAIFAQFDKGELPQLSKVITLENGNPSAMQEERLTILYRIKKRWCFLCKEDNAVDLAMRISKTGCSNFTVHELTMEEEVYKNYERWQL